MLPRGRRKGWRKRPREEKENFTTIMVSKAFKSTVEFELRTGERLCDTIERVWSEKASKIGELYRKLRDTEEELKQYKTNE